MRERGGATAQAREASRIIPTAPVSNVLGALGRRGFKELKGRPLRRGDRY